MLSSTQTSVRLFGQLNVSAAALRLSRFSRSSTADQSPVTLASCSSSSSVGCGAQPEKTRIESKRSFFIREMTVASGKCSHKNVSWLAGDRSGSRRCGNRKMAKPPRNVDNTARSDDPNIVSRTAMAWFDLCCTFATQICALLDVKRRHREGLQRR